MSKPAYHELEEQIAHLHHKLDVLSRAVVEAQRDPLEYRRGYHAGYDAGRRRAPQAPDEIKRRIRA